MSQTRLSAVPTNIITGFLGSGKTTAINHLLQQRPKGERWAVLVNEFGQVGIDASLITETDGVAVKELAGGCLCCALGPSLPITLATLLRRARPDRLLIEPTGLGHPARIIDTLQSDQFKDVLSLHSIICLLDPGVLHQPDTLSQPSFIDQLNLADRVVLNRTDLASAEDIAEAHTLSANLFPPKAGVHQVSQGQLELAWLDLPHSSERQAEYPQAHAQAAITSPLTPPKLPTQPKQGQPVYEFGQGEDHYSYGWIFHSDDCFDWDQIRNVLDKLDTAVRVKAVLRIGHARVGYNRNAGQAATTAESAWRRDSRLEILTRERLDKAELEQALLNCLNI